MKKTALAIVAHPDDAEFLCAGTLTLLHNKGWHIHMTTITAGDCGSKVLGKKEISEVRVKEAANAASLIDAGYECLGFEDLFILYDRPSITTVVAHVRKIQPQLVITMSPSCYMVDHEHTSKLVQSACFAAGIVNIATPGIKPLDYIPHLYYADAMEGKDKLGQPIKGSTIVDITSVMDIKTEMLACHASQREWLRQHHGMDQYILNMQQQAMATGKDIGISYAEGFRQHLGHAFPQDNLLYNELQEYTILREISN
jgi:LmbE family N-acetylglucosaminyl deacetylase